MHEIWYIARIFSCYKKPTNKPPWKLKKHIFLYENVRKIKNTFKREEKTREKYFNLWKKTKLKTKKKKL